MYDIPFGKGRTYGGGINSFADAVLGGWAIEGIVQIQTGRARNVTTGTDPANVGKYQARADISGDPALSGDARSVDRWFNTGVFSLPKAFTFGNSGANVIQSDGRTIADISIAKKFKIMEKQSLEFRTEFFNMPNAINFGDPNTTYGAAAFGKITGATSARQIQFALRYAF